MSDRSGTLLPYLPSNSLRTSQTTWWLSHLGFPHGHNLYWNSVSIFFCEHAFMRRLKWEVVLTGPWCNLPCVQGDKQKKHLVSNEGGKQDRTVRASVGQWQPAEEREQVKGKVHCHTSYHIFSHSFGWFKMWAQGARSVSNKQLLLRTQRKKSNNLTKEMEKAIFRSTRYKEKQNGAKILLRKCKLKLASIE